MTKHNHQANQHHIQCNLQCNHHMDIDHLLPMQFEGRYQFAAVNEQRSVRPILIINYNFCPPTQTPTQSLEYGFYMFCSQEIGLGQVSFLVIFEALHCRVYNRSYLALYAEFKNPKNHGIQPIYNSCLKVVFRDFLTC